MFQDRPNSLRINAQILLSVALIAGLTACSRPASPQVDVVVTIPPLRLIVQEIVGEEEAVVCLLPPGSSPHTFELRPSTARALGEARAILYTDETIDGWAARMAPGREHSVFALVPDAMRSEYGSLHHHESHAESSVDASSANAHFWSDPVIVREIVPGLVDILSTANPANAERYAANGAAFMASLDALDKEFEHFSDTFGDYVLVAFHPSWQYFFDRYGVTVSAFVEPFPGKEPTPQTIQALKNEMMRSDRRIVLSELQLPARSAIVLAESVGATVVVIDPIGGQDGRNTYADFLRYNANQVRTAFQ